MTPSSRLLLLLVVLVAVASRVAAIGPCNNTLIQELLAVNSANCPTNLLEKMYKEGPQVTFRVMAQKFSDMFSCATGVLEKPEKNFALLHNKFTYHNTSLGSEFVNYTMVEANCGYLYKYITEESYIGFKIVYAYVDGISFGYYGCTDEESTFYNESDIYAMCYAPSVDSEEVTESLSKCKAYMEAVTGASDLVLTDACDNDNEYLEAELARKSILSWFLNW